MNLLQVFITVNGLNETEVLNRLTEAGLISDLAVKAEDVADSDCERAVEYLSQEQ